MRNIPKPLNNWQPYINLMISQEIVIDGKRYKIALEGQFKVTPIDAPPVPNPDPEPGKPTEGTIKEGGWGAGTDATKWKATNMRNPSDQFKVVDDKDINVATNFKTLQAAQEFINYFKTHPFPPQEEGDGDKPEPEEPQEPDQPNTDSSQVTLVYPAKQGGQVVKDVEYKRSTHNQSNQKNIPRDSFYSKPKNYFKAANAQIAGYFNVDFKREDELSYKILGGGHSDSNAKAGACYAIGVNIDPGKATVPHIAKEIVHPDTPKFYNKAKKTTLSVPDLNNKTFGMRLNYWVTSKKTLAGRVDLDLSVLDKKIADLKTCPNKWETYYTFEDDGSWKNAPYLENQGLKHGDIALGMYIRIDNVGRKTETAFLGAVETAPTGV